MEQNFQRRAPGGDRTLDLPINFNTVYKYDALADWATGANPNSNAWSLSITVHSLGHKDQKLLIWVHYSKFKACFHYFLYQFSV